MDEAEMVQTTAKEILTKLGFANTTISTTTEEEGRINVQINVPLEDSGMLIGFHGETLSSLQLILGQTIYKKLGSWRTVILNVGDYRQKREAALESMAANAAQRVKLTQQPVTLPYLTSSERRLIHLALSQDTQVEPFSQGEGRDRRLVIAPKKEPVKQDSSQEQTADKGNA